MLGNPNTPQGERSLEDTVGRKRRGNLVVERDKEQKGSVPLAPTAQVTSAVLVLWGGPAGVEDGVSAAVEKFHPRLGGKWAFAQVLPPAVWDSLLSYWLFF